MTERFPIIDVAVTLHIETENFDLLLWLAVRWLYRVSCSSYW